MLLGAYRIALDSVRAAAEAAVTRLILSLYDRDDRDASIRALTPALTEVVRANRREAYGLAGEMMRGQARSQGAPDPYVPSQSGYSEASVRSVLDEDLRGSPDEAVQIIAPRLGQHVEDSARQTVVRAVEDGREPATDAARARRSRDALSKDQFDELAERRAEAGEDFADWEAAGELGHMATAYARVLTGAENCGFCVMLASRGPVYSSAESAGERRASEILDTRNERFINSYHPNCDCLVVPVYSYADWPGREQWRELEKFYRKALEDREWTGRYPKNPDLAAVEQALRRLEREGESLPIGDLRAAGGALDAAA